MQTRFIKSVYILAAIALAWIAGIVLLNVAYVRPSFIRQAQRVEREITGEWLRLANYQIRARRHQMLRCATALAGQIAAEGHLVGPAGVEAKGSLFRDALERHQVSMMALCDAERRVVVAWTLDPKGRLTREEGLRPGTHLADCSAFRYSPQAEEVSGVSETPLGPALFARCVVPSAQQDAPAAYLLSLRPLNDVFLAEVSAMVGADVGLRPASELSPAAGDEQIGSATWRDEDHSLLGTQPLRFSTGELAGQLIVQGRAEPSYWQARTFGHALTSTLVWAAGFALLMIVVIHVVVSGPTARLLRRVERLQAGEEVDSLSAGLRGEALALARQFEEVLEHIEKISQTDSLTGVHNRRSFQQAFIREFHRARRYRRPLGLTMMDIDFLKAANDVLGHQTGDLILQVFARVIQDNIRSSDLVARLGGDEFAILMPETTEKEAAALAERIRACLSSKSIGPGEVKMNPTISVGVVDLNCPNSETPDALFNLADRAMYTAKRAGRNRIVRGQQLEEAEAVEAGDDRSKVDHLCRQLAGLDAKFKRLFVEAIGGLISALEARDVHTANHSTKVRRYAVMIARELKLPERTVEHIGRAAILHDIGKIGLPDSILLKDGPLDEQEWSLVKRHPVISVRIMEGMEFLDQEIPSVRYHHERYDGRGYPEGLGGSAIPLGARILAVADAFDAMTSSRVYRSCMSVEEALQELRAGRGGQFDPAAVDAFVKVVKTAGITDEILTVAGSSPAA